MHHEMHIRQQAMDFFDDMHREDRAIRLAREFIRAMRRAHSNGERINFGGAHEISGFLRVGQQLIMAELAFSAMAVFLVAHARFKRAQHAKFALD